MRIHTNEKPYECDVCEKSFRQYGNVRDVIENHALLELIVVENAHDAFTRTRNRTNAMCARRGIVTLLV